MLESFTSRSGTPSLRIDGITLHSAYDPVREAQRFVETSFQEDVPATVIILGEGIGYCTAAVKARFPAARIIPVYYSQEIYSRRVTGSSPAWHPGDPRGLADFMRECIGELDAEGLKVVEWPVSARLFPELSTQANHAVRQAVQEANGGLVTTAATGRLWIRNAITNFVSLDNVLAASNALFAGGAGSGQTRPIVIAASGPSLQDLLPALALKRAAYSLWALPGSCLMLREAGLEPDLVVMTDSGHWSATHLHFCRSRGPIAMPLSAARGAWMLAAGVLLLAQPTFFETALMDAAGLASPMAAPHGTVTATALDLALSAGNGPVILAGVDLCLRDIVPHGRPNAFDQLRWLEAGRLSPHYSITFNGACSQPSDVIRTPRGAVRVTRPLKTYAGWLSSGLDSRTGSGRLFRLAPSPIDLPRAREMDRESFLALPEEGMPSETVLAQAAWPTREKRLRIVGRLLADWEKSFQEAARGLQGRTLTEPSARFLSLAYYIETGLLVEVRRSARQGKSTKARESAMELVENGTAFLRHLAGKIQP